MTNTLVTECYDIKQAIDGALGWVRQNLPTEKQYSTIDRLRRLRRTALRYEKVATQRPSAAIFGQSQTGKSYLVSNLVRRPNERALEILTPNIEKETIKRLVNTDKVDFLRHINPDGRGKESTGFVTRFSTDPKYTEGKTGFMVRLFSQSDVIKILANGYMNDINDYSFQVNREELQQIFQAARQRATDNPNAGCSEDDVLDIRDYLNEVCRENPKLIELNTLKYWDDAAQIAPRLNANDRWIIFEILWGKQPFFTDLCRKLTQALVDLSFATDVWCGLDAITDNQETIIDIERLREMYDDYVVQKNKETLNAWHKPASVTVIGGNGARATLDRSILSALARELVLPLNPTLAEEPKRKMLAETDILDFPGARSRMNIKEDTFTHQNSTKDKVEVFVRGKVAYLFDLYQMNFEINSLLFCMDDSQPNVKELQDLVYRWVGATHGKAKDKREDRERKLGALIPNAAIERLIPLLFIATKFNNNLQPVKSTDMVGNPRCHDGKWNSRFQANFSSWMTLPHLDKWTQDWNVSDRSFKNAFLLRDPSYPADVYEGYTDGNERIKQSEIDRMKDIETSFIEHPFTNLHFRNPRIAWQEATTAGGDGGVSYIIKYLEPVCNATIKTEQISEAIKLLRLTVGKELCNHYEGGDVSQKLDKAFVKGFQIFAPLSMMQDHFGAFLNALMLPEDIAWKIYYDLENVSTATPSVSDGASSDAKLVKMKETLKRFGINDLNSMKREQVVERLTARFRINEETLLKTLAAQQVDLDALFGKEIQLSRQSDIYAERLLAEWIKIANSLKTHPDLQKWGLELTETEIIIEEMIKNMDRIRLKKIIADAVDSHIKNFSISGNNDIVARIASLKLNEFVNTLGWSFVSEAEKKEGNIKVSDDDVLTIFAARPVPRMRKEDLVAALNYPGERHYSQWLAGIHKSFEYNVLKEANLSNADRARAMGLLGDIIQKLDYVCA